MIMVSSAASKAVAQGMPEAAPLPIFGGILPEAAVAVYVEDIRAMEVSSIETSTCCASPLCSASLRPASTARAPLRPVA